MKDRTKEQPPSIVPETAQQEGEIRARWGWVEPAVWTERMLATLETGIEGGKWFRLIDKVWSPKNLARSLQKVVAKGGSAGIDHQSASQVGEHPEQTIQKLEQELRRPIPATSRQTSMDTQAWEPRETTIRSTDGQRPDRARSSAPSHRTDLRTRIRPQSYGFRPGKGCKDALRRVDELLRSGHHWVVDADLKSYFDSIPHEGLMEGVEEKIADSRVLNLIGGML